MPPDPDWFRSPTWDGAIAAEFERRLARALPRKRPQYVRIQATHLLESHGPGMLAHAHGLLRRVVRDYPEHMEAKFAVEQLGVSLAEFGRLGEAEAALRECVRLCAESPIGRSGTSGTPELTLAEVLIATGDDARLAEAAHLLDVIAPEVEARRNFRDLVFRHLLATARVAHRRHDRSAVDLADRALAVAAETEPTFARHPDVGRPDATDADLTELRRIQGG